MPDANDLKEKFLNEQIAVHRAHKKYDNTKRAMRTNEPQNEAKYFGGTLNKSDAFLPSYAIIFGIQMWNVSHFNYVLLLNADCNRLAFSVVQEIYVSILVLFSHRRWNEEFFLHPHAYLAFSHVFYVGICDCAAIELQNTLSMHVSLIAQIMVFV